MLIFKLYTMFLMFLALPAFHAFERNRVPATMALERLWVPAANADNTREPAVAPGIDRVFQPPFVDQLRGLRLGVLSNPVSRTREGTHLADALHSRSDLELKVIFAPEHGFRGSEDIQVPDSKDPVTGLPVFSLYGPRLAPTAQQLALVDAVIIDLQDVGVRYYTYAATMALTMKACKAAGKKVFVLDRPNPLGGEIVEGAMLEPALQGGISTYYPMPARHGMTLGEIARLFNRELAIDADLTVVPVAGWTRSMSWSETGMPWIAPSPALVTLEQTILYGIFGPMEAMNLAVGRGKENTEAFRVYGAPWITDAESKRLTEALSALNLPGLRFSKAQWVPTRREYQGKLCRGFRVEFTDAEHPERLEGFRSLIEVVKTLRRIFGTRLYMNGMDGDVGSRWFREGIERGLSTEAMLERSRRESHTFLKQRADALLY